MISCFSIVKSFRIWSHVNFFLSLKSVWNSSFKKISNFFILSSKNTKLPWEEEIYFKTIPISYGVKAFVSKRDKNDEKSFVTRSSHCALTRALLERFFMLLCLCQHLRTKKHEKFLQTNKTKLLRREKC